MNLILFDGVLFDFVVDVSSSLIVFGDGLVFRCEKLILCVVVMVLDVLFNGVLLIGGN